MRTYSIYGASLLAAASLTALASSACGPSGPSVDDLNQNMNGGTSSGGTGSAVSGTSAVTAGSGNTAPVGGSGGSSAMPNGGSGGSTSGGAGPQGGSAPQGGSEAQGGSGGAAPVGPYTPRTGSFKMLVLTRTKGFRHTDSINTGVLMLQQIAQEQGFELTFAGSAADDTASDAEVAAQITPEALANYEIIFHMNTTGDMFNDAQQKIYEDWMTTKNGAFAGVHSATDTESGWPFYSDVTGQYYNGHGAVVPDTIVFEQNMLNFPALKGIQTPWQRNEEWYKFNNFQEWSAKPGFQILGRKTADGQPIMWTREWGNFRAFYTAIGHEGVVFQDPQVKKHLTGGIMWAVRRELSIK
jgi:type 1 glutamine amidotransferase